MLKTFEKDVILKVRYGGYKTLSKQALKNSANYHLIIPKCRYLFSQVKTEGYDGKEANVGDDVEDEPSQWSISGALLYSVTIITTIGE